MGLIATFISNDDHWSSRHGWRGSSTLVSFTDIVFHSQTSIAVHFLMETNAFAVECLGDRHRVVQLRYLVFRDKRLHQGWDRARDVSCLGGFEWLCMLDKQA